MYIYIYVYKFIYIYIYRYALQCCNGCCSVAMAGVVLQCTCPLNGTHERAVLRFMWLLQSCSYCCSSCCSVF